MTASRKKVRTAQSAYTVAEAPKQAPVANTMKTAKTGKSSPKDPKSNLNSHVRKSPISLKTFSLTLVWS